MKSTNLRALQVLKRLVERYIQEGQPIGSKALAEESTFGLSPATIRNIMSELEHAGYLTSPHTSAGRVPTAQGYRLFVDSLLTIQPLNRDQVEQLQNELVPDTSSHSLISKASSLLSSITQLAGVVTLPRKEHLILRQVEFLPLSENRLLVILVINEHEIQNRLIHTDRTYTPTELQEAGNYLTRHYAGIELSEMRTRLIKALQTDRKNIEHMMQVIVDTAEKVFPVKTTDDYVLAGEANLLSLAEETSVEKLRSLFAAFQQKNDLLHLLDRSIHGQGMQIFIGEESGYQSLDPCSLVTAPYDVDGKRLGVLGVIGSTRMPYERVIAAVDITAKMLSIALTG